MMSIQEGLQQIIAQLESMDVDDKVFAINDIKSSISKISPFKDEPIDFVQWVKVEDVKANDYNPNAVAPPEMELLRHSIAHDGYTQPVVTWKGEDEREVIDGFHRTRVCRECDDVNSRVMGYLPVVTIKDDCSGRNDRIASTIRHNRARGKHQVESMSDIVVELKKRNWSDNKIAKELGMDQDEVLRLCQITGLTEVFSNDDFSHAWESTLEESDVNIFIQESDVVLCDSDSDRIFHEWDNWECYKAGFYSDHPPEGMKPDECQQYYCDFLSDIEAFESALKRVISEWKFSCEHYLTNDKMNRIAWLGQASLCIVRGIPSKFCGGYNLLSDEQKQIADKKALDYLNIWLAKNGREPLSWEDSKSKTKANIY